MINFFFLNVAFAVTHPIANWQKCLAFSSPEKAFFSFFLTTYTYENGCKFGDAKKCGKWSMNRILDCGQNCARISFCAFPLWVTWTAVTGSLGGGALAKWEVTGRSHIQHFFFLQMPETKCEVTGRSHVKTVFEMPETKMTGTYRLFSEAILELLSDQGPGLS